MKNEKCLKTTSKKAIHRFTALAAVLLAVCLVFMMPVSAADTISISSAEDLKKIGKEASHPLDGSYILTDNINLNDQEWMPIGTMNNPFTGNFNGNGKTISGLKITDANDGFVGLFSYIGTGGSVTNLAVSGDIDATETGNDGIFAGGIAGLNCGTISCCSFIGNITAKSPLSACAGGIAGINEYGTISDCYSIGDIAASYSDSDSVITMTGGIAGKNFYGTITNCYSTGTVTAISKSTGDGTAYAGGIAGMDERWRYDNTTTISNCYALNAIVTAEGVTKNNGRVVGENSSGNLAGNFGWTGMKIADVGVTDVTATDKNGTSVYAVNFWKNIDFFGGFDTTIWEINEDYPLPLLNGQTISSV